MLVTHLVYYVFSALVGVIVFVSLRNLSKSRKTHNALTITVWALLLVFAILYWIYVSYHTDADTIALYLLESKLRLTWAKM